jgi:hypothetical protein
MLMDGFFGGCNNAKEIGFSAYGVVAGALPSRAAARGSPYCQVVFCALSPSYNSKVNRSSK